MFCYNCGKEMPEGSAFCANCGAAANGQPAAAVPVAVEKKPSLFASFLAILKSVFSKNVVKTVGAQAKNTGKEWMIGGALSVLSFALAFALNVLEGLDALISFALDSAAGSMGAMGAMMSQVKGQIMDALAYPFFSFFGAGLLVGLITFAAAVAGIWLLTKLVAKKDASWICVLNLVATATIPLSACYVANMLLGLIWFPLPIVISLLAMCMTIVLLYVGFQKLEKPEVSPFYPYTALVAVLVVVAFGIGSLVFKGVAEAWLGRIMSTVGGLLGNSMDIFGNLFG